jgi:opacity protein-like surface antigen
MRGHEEMQLRSSFLVLLLLTAIQMFAQSSTSRNDLRWEVSPFIGYETHGSYPIDSTSSNVNQVPPTVDRIQANGGMSYGGMLDYTLNPNLQFEFLYVRNPTTYSQHDFTTDVTTPIYDSTVSTFQWGALAQFRVDQKLRPYIAGGLGFAHESNSGLNPNRTAFAYNLGGGAKYFINDHFGFRGELRYMPTYGNSGQGVQCNYFGSCYQATVRNYEKRVNLAAGIIFRF